MSLLLQLLDGYRDFEPAVLSAIADELEPRDISSIMSVFGELITRLPSSVLVVLIVDGLKFFGHPMERRSGLVQVIEHLVDIYRNGSEAKLKFLFANSMRSELVEDYLFGEQEVLRIPQSSVRGVLGALE